MPHALQHKDPAALSALPCSKNFLSAAAPAKLSPAHAANSPACSAGPQSPLSKFQSAHAEAAAIAEKCAKNNAYEYDPAPLAILSSHFGCRAPCPAHSKADAPNATTSFSLPNSAASPKPAAANAQPASHFPAFPFSPCACAASSPIAKYIQKYPPNQSQDSSLPISSHKPHASANAGHAPAPPNPAFPNPIRAARLSANSCRSTAKYQTPLWIASCPPRAGNSSAFAANCHAPLTGANSGRSQPHCAAACCAAHDNASAGINAPASLAHLLADADPKDDHGLCPKSFPKLPAANRYPLTAKNTCTAQFP